MILPVMPWTTGCSSGWSRSRMRKEYLSSWAFGQGSSVSQRDAHIWLTSTNTSHLSMDHDLSRWAKMPLATCDVEGMFLVSIQVKQGADIEEVRDKLLKMVTQLSNVDGTSDVQVAMIRQRITQGLHPGGLSRIFSTLRGSQLIDRTNQELQRISKTFAFGDLKAHSDRVEAVSGRGVREAVAHHLTPQKVVVVRVESSN